MHSFLLVSSVLMYMIKLPAHFCSWLNEQHQGSWNKEKGRGGEKKNFPTYTSCMINKRSGRCLMMLSMTRIKVGCMMMMSIENRMMSCCCSRCYICWCIWIVGWCIKWVGTWTCMLMMNACRRSVGRWRCRWTIRCCIIKSRIMFDSTGCCVYIELCSKSWIEWRWKVGKRWVGYGTTTRIYRWIKWTTADWRWRGRCWWWTIFRILQWMQQIHNDMKEYKIN